MNERTFDVTIRVHYLPEVEVDGVPTTTPDDWNYDAIIGLAIPSVTFVSVVDAKELIRGN
jgi:hypothetical protein